MQTKVQDNKRDYIFYQPRPQFSDDKFYDLYDMMKSWAGSDDTSTMATSSSSKVVNTFPVRKLAVPYR